MANKFLNGIEVSSSAVVDGGSLSTGSTILDIQGSQGQLFSVTNSLVGDLFSVSDISGVPILNVNSSGLVTVDGDQTVDGHIKMITGSSTGKFAVMSTGVHGSYDFYNNGTSYLNGTVVVDAAFLQTGGLASTFSGGLKTNDGSAGSPAYSFTDDTNTGIWRSVYSGSSMQLNIAVDGVNRGSFNSAGITSSANFYTPASGSFRNYSGVWKATTGLTGNGFQFITTDSTALTLSSTGNAVFAGSISAITASGHDFMLGNSNNTSSADTSGFRMHQSATYDDGRYAHRFRKYDHGGGIPLYIDSSGSTANIFTASARFGTYTGESKTFEVFGTMGATNFSGSSSGANTGDETKARINALDITELGTISSGVWQGSAISQTYLTGQSGTNTGDQDLSTYSLTSDTPLFTWDSTADLTSPSASTGTWTNATATDWGTPKIGTSLARFNDGTGTLSFTVPTGMKTAYISQLTWSSGGYMDVYGVQADGDEVFLRRINTKQTIENSNEGNPNQHDGTTIAFAGHIGDFPTIMLHNKVGRFHLTGLGFSKSELAASDGTGIVNYSQLTGTVPTWNQDTNGNSATVTTNANLTGHITSVGNAAVLGSFTTAELNAAISDGSINSQNLSGYLLNTTDTLAGKLTITGTEGLEVGGIRGRAIGNQTGDFIQLYERVHIGYPSGWGASAAAAPSNGLSTWGSVDFGMNGTGVIQLDGTTIVTAARALTNITDYGLASGDIPNNAADTTGNAATASSATIASRVTINSGFSGTYPMLVEVESSGIIYNNTNVTYNGSSSTLTSPNFSGNLTGNVTGNVTGSAGSVAWGNITSRPYILNSIVTSATTTTTVANVLHATYTAAFFDFVIKNGTNVRAGIVYACHDGTNVEYAETSTVDLGDTSDVTLSVEISGTNMRLRATTTSSTWTIKSLIRAI